MIELREATPAERDSWDALVRRFANHRVVHTKAWIESLEASGCGRPLYLVYEQDGHIVGCLPGLLVKVGRWKVFGSPLPGWQTVSLGPAYDADRLSCVDLMSALVPFLELHHGVDHVELLHDGLDHASMRAAGFRGSPVFTYRAPLFPGDDARAFQALKDSARRNVRRAERLGLVVRVEHDEPFVDEHYDQLTEVYLRGGHTIPFGKTRVLECFRRMRDAGRLLALSVLLPGGRVNIATGMFLLEGRELLLWMWAHRQHYRWYRPTELMTWTAMRWAARHGAVTFDLMGAGEFKPKFGAVPDQTKFRWVRSRHRWLTHARDLAEAGFRWQQAVRGRAALLVRTMTRLPTTRRAPPACVMGDVDLVRTLGLAGLSATVLAPPGSPARHSRHTRGVVPWSDAWARPDDLVETLVGLGQAEPEPPALFYEDDGSLLLVSRQRERLRTAFRFVVPDADLVEQLVDKARFQELAQRLDLPVPAARVLHPAGGPMPADLGLPYPLVLKPLTRQPAQWEPTAGVGKAVRVDSLDDLRRHWPRLAAANLTVLAQQLVPGPETKIESYHVYVEASGGIVGEFTGRKIRTWPVSFGDSTAIEVTEAPDVLALGRDVIRRLKLRGVAKLDFKRGPDGHLSLLEVNPRFNLWHHVGARAGVNLPALVYADLVGWPRPPASEVRAGVRWCKPWLDLRAARAAGISLFNWLRWWLGCDATAALAWDDPWPLAGAVLQRAAAVLRFRGPDPRLLTMKSAAPLAAAPETPHRRTA